MEFSLHLSKLNNIQQIKQLADFILPVILLFMFFHLFAFWKYKSFENLQIYGQRVYESI